MSFPILNLPYVAQRVLFSNVGPIELFHLYNLSNRMENVVGKVHHGEIDLNIFCESEHETTVELNAAQFGIVQLELMAGIDAETTMIKDLGSGKTLFFEGSTEEVFKALWKSMKFGKVNVQLVSIEAAWAKKAFSSIIRSLPCRKATFVCTGVTNDHARTILKIVEKAEIETLMMHVGDGMNETFDALECKTIDGIQTFKSSEYNDALTYAVKISPDFDGVMEITKNQ